MFRLRDHKNAFICHDCILRGENSHPNNGIQSYFKSSDPEMPKELQPSLAGSSPVSKWLGSPPFSSHLGHLEGEQPYLGVLLIMVINH